MFIVLRVTPDFDENDTEEVSEAVSMLQEDLTDSRLFSGEESLFTEVEVIGTTKVAPAMA